MADSGVKIKGLENVQERFDKLSKNIKYNPKMMNQVGNYVQRDIVKMFSEGGDPKWPISQRAKQEGGQTLLDTGKHLRGSINYEISSSENNVTIGTNSAIAPSHNFGAKMKGGQPYRWLGPEIGLVFYPKGTSGPGIKKTKPYKMPKREFMFFRPKTVKGVITRMEKGVTE